MTEPIFSTETQQQAAAFDHIGEQYEAVFGTNATQLRVLQWLLPRLPKEAQVLDVGSGTGVPTARLLTEAGHHVTGIDISQEMVRIAQRQAPAATFYQMDVADLHFAPASFHAITAFFSLLMLRRSAIETSLAHLATLLRPLGYFILSMIEGDFDYIELPFLGQPVHVSAYPRQALQAVLEAASFTVLDCEAVEFQAGADAPPETQLFFSCQRQL